MPELPLECYDGNMHGERVDGAVATAPVCRVQREISLLHKPKVVCLRHARNDHVLCVPLRCKEDPNVVGEDAKLERREREVWEEAVHKSERGKRGWM